MHAHQRLAKYFSILNPLDKRRKDELPWHLQKVRPTPSTPSTFCLTLSRGNLLNSPLHIQSNDLDGLRTFLCNIESFQFLRSDEDTKIEMDVRT